MIENLMILALGVLAASLVWLALLGAVWRRAVRLTTKRLHGQVPLSMVDIKADKDHLRAEFAVAVRKQEMANEGLRESLNERAIALATRDETIRDLHETLALREQAINGLNEDVARRDGLLTERGQELESTTKAWQESEEELAKTRDENTALERAQRERDALIDSQRIEAVAHQTQIDNLRLAKEQADRALASLKSDHDALRQVHAEAVDALTRERQALLPLQEELHTLKTTLGTRDATIAESHAALTDLSASHARLAETARQGGEQIAALEHALAASRQAHEALSAAHEAYRREAEDKERAFGTQVETLLSDKTLAEGALAHAREDREALQHNLAAARKAASGFSGDSNDAALLREKISAIAAQVAHHTAAKEGTGSPINAILARTAPGLTPALADKILALRAGSGPT